MVSMSFAIRKDKGERSSITEGEKYQNYLLCEDEDAFRG